MLVYRYRVKSNLKALRRQAKSVNIVWNYANETQRIAVRRRRPWLTGFDLNKLTAGANKDLVLHSGTINAVCEQYAKSRKQHRRPWLRFRGRRSLGWIPFKGRDIKTVGDGFKFHGRRYRVWMSRALPKDVKIRDGSNFSQDAKGNWYLNLVVDIPLSEPRGTNRAVGIDLGLKDFANLSTGEKIGNPRYFQSDEDKLAKAQRANKKKQARAIHTRIANRRKDFLHKTSTRLVRDFDVIAVGNVSSSKLSKTKIAKSVHDTGWSDFRRMLAYKSIANGVCYEEVDERFSTQTCSVCGNIGGPKGREGLVVREWTCSSCGALHDRDTNAAQNLLLRLGHQTPAQGILSL